MSYKIIGRCSECGGNVVVPAIWYGVNPPTPYCESCHATMVNNLPVIPMKPNSWRIRPDDNRWICYASQNLEKPIVQWS